MTPVHVAGVERIEVATARLVDDDRVRVLGQKHLADQGRLARPGHAGDRDQHAGGDVEVESAQVVGRRVA